MNNTMSFDVMQNIMGQLVSVTKSNSENVAVILKDLEETKMIIGGLSKKINNYGDEIGTIKDEIENLKLNEEITEEQANNLNKSAKRRIVEVLKGNELDMAKYFRYFILRLYSDMKKYHNMGSSFKTTKKRYYQSLIDNIEAWIPDEGIQKLKEKIDKKAEAKRIARENGYID